LPPLPVTYVLSGVRRTTLADFDIFRGLIAISGC